MTVEEIEDRALMRIPLNGEYSFPDKWLYLCFRALHSEYRLGQISREQGAYEKRMLLKTYSEMQFAEKFEAKNVLMWKRTEDAASKFGRRRTLENADNFYAAVYGLPKNWRIKRDKETN